jgi:phospholipid/cholesterol/gamma-HCH transport system ATP-binding protein
MSAATQYFFQIRDLHKTLGGQHVLRGVTLDICRGERMVIIGGSGQGKSVLLKHLTGLMQPDSGTILLDGQEIAQLTERELAAPRRKLGILFQEAALFDSQTVAENVAFPLNESRTVPKAEIETRVQTALESVGLVAHGHKLPGELSGGMRKRAGLARAIVTEPDCVLYDEPTSGLDPILSDSIDHLIVRLQNRSGKTAVVVTHDMKSVRTVADRVALLRGGRIYFLGTSAELHASQDPVIQAFVEGKSDATDL